MESYCVAKQTVERQGINYWWKNIKATFIYKHVKALNVTQISCGFGAIIRGSHKVCTLTAGLKFNQNIVLNL